MRSVNTISNDVKQLLKSVIPSGCSGQEIGADKLQSYSKSIDVMNDFRMNFVTTSRKNRDPVIESLRNINLNKYSAVYQHRNATPMNNYLTLTKQQYNKEV